MLWAAYRPVVKGLDHGSLCAAAALLNRVPRSTGALLAGFHCTVIAFLYHCVAGASLQECGGREGLVPVQDLSELNVRELFMAVYFIGLLSP